MTRALLSVVGTTLMVAACAPTIHSTLPGPPSPVQLAELWQSPDANRERDLFWGPFGRRLAPDPDATYTFVKEKTSGTSPGLTVRDEKGIEWSVKQGQEASVEVTVSRILSAAGYHQPPVYYLRRWKLKGGADTKAGEAGGRFRPKLPGLKERGDWSWQQNPFVGTVQYEGLLVLLMILNGTDLKNPNNSLYEAAPSLLGADAPARWYVVRDLGSALGETGRLDPLRGDALLFAGLGYIQGVKAGYVRFDYHGRHQELVRHISVDAVRWTSRLLSGLSEEQWHDAFRAGGFRPDEANIFIPRILQKIDEGQNLGS